MRSKSDAELMELVRERHRPALEELYDRYVRLVYSYAMKSSKSEQSSREIVQLVFTRLWTTQKGYDPAKGQFVNWLLTITRNLTIDHIRMEQRKTADLPADTEQWEQLPVPPEHSPEAVVMLHFTRQEIRAAYTRLSESQIRLIERVYWEGYTLSEAAVIDNEPLGTIKSRLHQTLKTLRKYMLEQREG